MWQHRALHICGDEQHAPFTRCMDVSSAAKAQAASGSSGPNMSYGGRVGVLVGLLVGKRVGSWVGVVVGVAVGVSVGVAVG